jgi:hypothetical protein
MFKQTSTRKLMATVFRDRSADGGIHETWDSNNITSVFQNNKILCRAIGMLTSDTLLLYNNECLCTAARTSAFPTGRCLTILLTALISLRATTTHLPTLKIGCKHSAT